MTANHLSRFDEFDLDPLRRTLLRNGQPVQLSPKAFEVLLCLVSHPGEVVTKEHLLKTVWPDSFVEEGNLAQHISALRKAFGDRTGYIVTVPGRGYQFAAPVELPKPEAFAAQPADVVMQRVRERTHIVVEEPMPANARQNWLARNIRSQWIAWGMAAVAVSLAAYFGWQRLGPQPQLRKVVVADFLNLTGDPAIDHTLSSGLVLELEQSPYIQVMSGGLIHQTLEHMQKPLDTPLLGDTVLEICERAGYQALLQGKILHTQNNPGYDLALEVVNCATGKNVALLKGQAQNKDSIIDALNGLAIRSRVKLGEPNSSLDNFNVSVGDASTYSLEALKDYNLGVTLSNAGKLEECVPYFKKALEIDPKFARAYADLANAFWTVGKLDQAAATIKTAFDLSGNETQNERFHIRSAYYLQGQANLIDAAKTYEEWVRVYPDDEAAWMGMSRVYRILGNNPGRAIEAGVHALQVSVLRPSMAYRALALAYLRVNRLSDVKRVIAEAQADGKDATNLHYILYEVAVIERDPASLKREEEWAVGKPEYYSMLQAETVRAADEGRINESESLLEKTIAEALKAGNADFADGTVIDEANFELSFGRTEKARELLHRAKDKQDPDYITAAIRCGDLAAGEAFIRQHEADTQNTILHFVILPRIRTLLALRQKKLPAAVVAIEPAEAFPLSNHEVLGLAGDAYLASGNAESAIHYYRERIAHPGLEDPMFPLTVVAHLGLARAYAMEHKIADSRSEYEDFFARWKDADTGLPILEQARREYAQLPAPLG